MTVRYPALGTTADYVGGPPITNGNDVDRPAASTGRLGSIYYADDVQVAYECRSVGGVPVWSVAGMQGNAGRDRTGVATGGVINAGGSANVDSSTVTGFAVCFSLVAHPAGGRTIFSVLQGGPVGFQLEIGHNGGNLGQLGIFRSGVSTGRVQFVGASIASPAGLNTPHIIACRFDGANTRFSLDGGLVGEAADTGTATHTTTPVRLNTNGIGGSGPDADHIAFKLWSSALTDPDLVALSGAYATGRIPDVVGSTIISDWHAARYLEWVTAQRVVRGTVPTVMTWNGAPPLVIR